MTESTLFVELSKNLGTPVLIFAIWYLYHKSQVKAFENIMKQNFGILKDLLETNQYHTALLSRIESKIDMNVWCPVIKMNYLNPARLKDES